MDVEGDFFFRNLSGTVEPDNERCYDSAEDVPKIFSRLEVIGATNGEENTLNRPGYSPKMCFAISKTIGRFEEVEGGKIKSHSGVEWDPIRPIATLLAPTAQRFLPCKVLRLIRKR